MLIHTKAARLPAIRGLGMNQHFLERLQQSLELGPIRVVRNLHRAGVLAGSQRRNLQLRNFFSIREPSFIS